ncbi:hypothetical protein DFQ27_006122 [Actinomortierella ambigua]|uniref:Uncharacterized protein n=1 Tax=Actinomortierella ambigua TaxID=1343610 RepID=A0A9P6PWS3_9FUNG|nr:hypothetical protein DFQ27_006122 [Actinomortierella ambigua]
MRGLAVNDNLPIHEEKLRGVYVKGLVEVYVSSIGEIHEVMRRGANNRMVAYTNMNAESSRSHSIFVITISQKNVIDGSVKSGKLYLVDLAGSEKVGKTGASGQTLEEAKKINKSLSALGMVINALTDGKSTHVPYRDSKLTRILQESLGGNSRTTLIINCSPSSFNDTETVSTLRFGMRAKNIKNKAKINQELSAAELKIMLKRVRAEALTFQQYISALEGEITIWRNGGTVPKTEWVSMEKMQSGAGSSSTSMTPLSSVPSYMAQQDASRPSTPAIALEQDEREEFLRHESELTDQLAEKEAELQAKLQLLEAMKEELNYLRDQDSSKTAHELNELRLQLEKVSFENKEGAITVDSLREVNQELSKEMEELKKTLMEMRVAQKNTSDGDKEKKKQEKMVQMMADLDPAGEMLAKETKMRETLFKLESPAGLTAEEAAAVRKELAEQRSVIEKHEQTITDLNHENATLTMKRDDLEMRLTAAELEYEELLDKTIADEEANSSLDVMETIAELRHKLEAQYAAKREQAQQELEDLKQDIARRNEEIQRLNISLSEFKRGNEELREQIEARSSNNSGVTRSSGLWEAKDMTERERDMERLRKTMAQQLADFDVMKKALMRDLQNRCEKVVELEISLDETREQYNQVLRNSSNDKNRQREHNKLAFLERNLEQLTLVQRQLVEQNTSLKKDVAIAERKLMARNERIQSLEFMLREVQEKQTIQANKFETQIQALRERLEQARSQKSNAIGLNFGRVVKPLRGGAPSTEAPAAPVDDSPSSPKNAAPDRDRRSWLAWPNQATLGSGGYGIVHKARWEGRTVAVKKFFVNATESAKDAIQNEIRILDQLRHQFIIKFLGTTHMDGQLIIIMEYAESGSLKRAIDRRLLGGGWTTKRRIVRQIAQGLDFMHAQNIMHLDLKSENVLLTAAMEVRLCDFGLSTVKTTSASRMDSCKGTIRWMAPELFTLNPRYSTKSDVYALGMIMWEMAANCTKPYRNQRYHGIIALLIERGERETLPRHTPEDYRAIVQQCWDPNPTNRPTAMDVDKTMGNADVIESDHLHPVEFIIQSRFEWNTLIEPNFSSFSALTPSTDTVPTFTLSDVQTHLPCTQTPSDAPNAPMDPQQSQASPPVKDIAVLSIQASSAVIEAQVELATIYEEGTHGVPKDDSQAFIYYHRAASHGNALAQYRLAKLYSDGRGSSQNDEEALLWYERAAGHGHVEAFHAIAQFFEQGRGGVAQSEDKAFHWLVKAAERGYPPAEYELGLKYQNRQSNSDQESLNHVEAVSWFWSAAEHGYADAQNALGALLKEGDGHAVEQDCGQALVWFRKAADQGHSAAQTNLGKMYFSGMGVQQDDQEAAALFRKAATQEYAAAQYALGWMYLQGRGVDHSEKEAASWFLKAANQGDALAELHLGWMYENGYGVPKDPVKAAMWSKLAEEQLSGDTTKARLEEFAQPTPVLLPQFFTIVYL